MQIYKLFSYHHKIGADYYIILTDLRAEWTTPLTVSARDGENDIIGMVNVAAAPFMANRATEFSGSLFSTSGTFTITLNDEWDAPWTGTW